MHLVETGVLEVLASVSLCFRAARWARRAGMEGSLSRPLAAGFSCKS